jgi:hypothetical protein
VKLVHTSLKTDLSGSEGRVQAHLDHQVSAGLVLQHYSTANYIYCDQLNKEGVATSHNFVWLKD